MKYVFSEWEKEILPLIVKGFTNREIAAELWLSVYTVKSHVRTILEKLGVTNRTQIAVKAVREGLIKEEIE